MPVDRSVLGELALTGVPQIEQVFVNAPAGWRKRDLERRLYMIRRRAEKRLEAGKAENGTVILSAEQKGSSIIIGIIDDGAGLNKARIVEKATQNGLTVTPDMPDSEIWQLIFQAGFSTAAEVTDVSGRGVGMDVVRRNIESIGGALKLNHRRVRALRFISTYHSRSLS